MVKIWKALVGAIIAYPLAGLSAVFVGGMMFWGGFHWSLELTNTEQFCVSCHAMRDYVYNEYKTTIHYNNRTGIRASCPDCHVPREWVYKVARKVRATNELFHWAIGSIDSKADFEAKRGKLAQDVWAGMEQTNSRECRNCHGIEFMAKETQSRIAGLMHSLAENWKMTCITCHKGIAHTLPAGFDRNLLQDQLHERMEKEGIECRPCHEGMAGSKGANSW